MLGYCYDRLQLIISGLPELIIVVLLLYSCFSYQTSIPDHYKDTPVLKMCNFTDKKVSKEDWVSSPFFVNGGKYKMCLSVDAAGYGDGEGTHVSVYLHLMKGPYDNELEQSGHWPLRGRFKIELLNQITGDNHYTRSILLSGYLCSDCTNRVVDGDMATGVGFDQFMSHNIIPDYVNLLVDDALHFRISYVNNKGSISLDRVAPLVINMTKFAERKRNKQQWYSSPFFAFDGGYLMCVQIYAAGYGDGEGTHVSVFLHLMKGPHDDKLERSSHWPLRGTFTIELLNPFTSHKNVMHGFLRSQCNEREVEDSMSSVGYGCQKFVSHDVIFYNRTKKHLKDDTLSFIIKYEDDSLPSPKNPIAPVTLVMPNFTEKVNNKNHWYSNPFYAFKEGYQMCLRIVTAGYYSDEDTDVSVLLYLMKGPYDNKLEQSGHWPLRGTFIIELLNQLNDSDHFMFSIPLYHYLCNKCTNRIRDGDIAPKGWGSKYISHNIAFHQNNKQYFVNDTLHFRISYVDTNPSTCHDQEAPIVFKVCNVTSKIKRNEFWFSSPFFAFKEGYRMCLVLCMGGYKTGEGTHVSFYTRVMKGPYDDKLEQSGHWPLRGTFTIELLNHVNNSDHHSQRAKMDNNRCSYCTKRVLKDNIASLGWGSHRYISHKAIFQDDKYLKDDCANFRISYEDTGYLTVVHEVAPVTFRMDYVVENIQNNDRWHSVPFLAFEEGYKLYLKVYGSGYGDGEGTHLSVFLCLMRGPHDDQLDWPLSGTFIIELLNQLNDSGHYIRTVAVYGYLYGKCTERVKKTDISDTVPKCCHFKFISHKALYSENDPEYLMDNSLLFKVSYERNPSLSHREVAPIMMNISDFTKRLERREYWSSSPFYLFEGGYLMCARVDFAGGSDKKNYYLSIHIHLLKGPYDDELQQSNQWPLNGIFLVELMYYYGYNEYLSHSKEIYYLSNETCGSCVTLKDGVGEGYGSDYVIPLKHVHAGLMNDEIRLKISYSICYNCIYLWNWSLKELLVFGGLCLLDGVSIFVLLVCIEVCKSLIETSNTISSLTGYKYTSIAWSMCKHTMMTLLFTLLPVTGKALTFIVWEFTDVMNYSSAVLISDMINKALVFLLYTRLVKIESTSMIFSPVWVIYIFNELCNTIYIVMFISVVVIINIYWPAIFGSIFTLHV